MDPAARVRAIEAGPTIPDIEPLPAGDCGSADETARSPFAPEHEALAVMLSYDGPDVIEPGEQVRVSAAMVNLSESTKHTFVLPGDGSQGGRREPSVAFAARVEVSPGCWRPVPRVQLMHCGIFDHEWADDLVTLGPGQRRELDPLWAYPQSLDFSQPGRVRLQVIYVWNGGATVHERARASPRAMADVAPYEIVSNEVEFTVETPLQLRVQAVPKPGEPEGALRDLVSVDLVNTSDRARAIRWPTAEILTFEVRGNGGRVIRGTWEPGTEPDGLKVEPGEALQLVGAARVNRELEYAVVEPLGNSVELRARLRPYKGRPEVSVASEWVRVELGASSDRAADEHR